MQSSIQPLYIHLSTSFRWCLWERRKKNYKNCEEKLKNSFIIFNFNIEMSCSRKKKKPKTKTKRKWRKVSMLVWFIFPFWFHFLALQRYFFSNFLFYWWCIHRCCDGKPFGKIQQQQRLHFLRNIVGILMAPVQPIR